MDIGLSIHSIKKSWARILATLCQGSKEGGMKPEQFPGLIQMDYNKTCEEPVVVEILEGLSVHGMAYKDGQDLWHATENGNALHLNIMQNRPGLLGKTTTPQHLMRA